MDFPEIYKRIVVEHNFDKNKILESKLFEEICPRLKEHVKSVLDDIEIWINSTENSYDFYWKNGHDDEDEEFLKTGYWDVDEYNEKCLTWEQARQQMGTTMNKYSLTQFFEGSKCEYSDIRDIAHILRDIGFKVIYAYYSSWGKGYDFIFSDYSTNWKVHDRISHICVSIN